MISEHLTSESLTYEMDAHKLQVWSRIKNNCQRKFNNEPMATRKAYNKNINFNLHTFDLSQCFENWTKDRTSKATGLLVQLIELVESVFPELETHIIII